LETEHIFPSLDEMPSDVAIVTYNNAYTHSSAKDGKLVSTVMDTPDSREPIRMYCT
jgi:hypothetical protein